MLAQTTLRTGLERLRARLEEDITERAEEEPTISAELRQRYETARTAKRTGLSFELWRAGEVTQSAVAWLLACTFVRFLEDNHLIEQPWISGPANRLAEAKEQNLRAYRAGQWQTDRDYLLLCSKKTANSPAYPLSSTRNTTRSFVSPLPAMAPALSSTSSKSSTTAITWSMTLAGPSTTHAFSATSTRTFQNPRANATPSFKLRTS